MKQASAMLAVLLALVVSANAIPSNNTTDCGGADVLATPKSNKEHFAGFGDATVLNWHKGDKKDLTSYDSPHSSATPEENGIGDLFFHRGGQGGGSPDCFTFDNSTPGTCKVPSVEVLSSCAVNGPTSNIANNVPDGGSTVVLLGATLSGLGLLGFRFKQ
jgi:hypothetical protein